MIKSSLVSIIVPCYNQGNFLNEALSSICNQSYTNWECIIVNDGSADDSERIATQWVEKDSRFRYFYKENSGVSATRNFALDNAKGDFIQFLDADDLLDETKLESCLHYLSESNDKNEKLVITNFRMLNVVSKKIQEPYCHLYQDLFTFNNILYQWNGSFSIPIHCGFFEASLFENIRFPENLTAQEDWLVWVKIFKLGEKAIFLDKPLVIYRINPKSRTQIKSFHDDQILAYENFKSILSADAYDKLTKVLISRYFKKQESYKYRLDQVKRTNVYQTGLMIKKVLKKMGLLSLFRKFFPFFLKFKAKE